MIEAHDAPVSVHCLRQEVDVLIPLEGWIEIEAVPLPRAHNLAQEERLPDCRLRLHVEGVRRSLDAPQRRTLDARLRKRCDNE